MWNGTGSIKKRRKKMIFNLLFNRLTIELYILQVNLHLFAPLVLQARGRRNVFLEKHFSINASVAHRRFLPFSHDHLLFSRFQIGSSRKPSIEEQHIRRYLRIDRGKGSDSGRKISKGEVRSNPRQLNDLLQSIRKIKIHGSKTDRTSLSDYSSRLKKKRAARLNANNVTLECLCSKRKR